MKFGTFYEHQLPRPWTTDSEHKLLKDAIQQVILADRLRTLGYTHATSAGISICVDDMHIPPDKDTENCPPHNVVRCSSVPSWPQDRSRR